MSSKKYELMLVLKSDSAVPMVRETLEKSQAKITNEEVWGKRRLAYKIGNITEGDVIVGSHHRAKIVKNKVSPPFKVAEFDMTANGISRSGGVLDVAVEKEIIEKSGSFFKYDGNMLAQGREATKALLEEKPELMKKIEKEIWDKIRAVEKADAKSEA